MTKLIAINRAFIEIYCSSMLTQIACSFGDHPLKPGSAQIYLFWNSGVFYCICEYRLNWCLALAQLRLAKTPYRAQDWKLCGTFPKFRELLHEIIADKKLHDSFEKTCFLYTMFYCETAIIGRWDEKMSTLVSSPSR